MTEEQLNEMAYDRALELMEAPMSFAIPSRELAKKLAGTEDEQIELAYGIDCFKMGYKQYAAEICLHLSEMFQKKPILQFDIDEEEFAKEWSEGKLIFVPSWTPTERQINALKIAISYYEEYWDGNTRGELHGLLNDLRKLVPHLIESSK